MKRAILALLLAGATTNALPQSTFHGNVARTGVYQGGAPATLTGVK